jgi:hypothetical protein
MNANLKPRPNPHSKEIGQAAAKKLAPAVAEWFQDGTTPAEIEEDLAKVLNSHSDGYAAAKALDDRCGYSPDARLVEILDDISSLQRAECERLEREWVKEQGLTGPSIGSKVIFNKDGKPVEGEVVSNVDTGRSLLFCASLGHVRDGVGTHGTYIVWEKLTPATA